MNQPLVSVIIPAWNGREHLEACLTALQAQSYSPLEVIVVDNASVDGSADLVERLFPDVKLIRNRYNLGFAGGCNTGLRVAEGDILMLLNQDTVANPNWVEALAEAVQDRKVGLVGSKIFYPDGQTIQHAGVWIEWPLGLAHHYQEEEWSGRGGEGEKGRGGEGEKGRGGERERGRVGEWESGRAGEWEKGRVGEGLEAGSCSVESVTGAAIAFRRDVMEQVGLLDEGFWPGYFEDADYCFRVRAAGYDVRYVPTAILLHKESTSITDQSLLSRYYQRGRLRFLLKHMSPERFLSEFVLAEEKYQQPAIFGYESLPLRMAYLEAIPQVVTILRERWQADSETIKQIVKALQRLHQLAWQHDWERVKAVLGPIDPTRTDAKATPIEQLPLIEPPQVGLSAFKMPEIRVPSLKAWKFDSSWPIIGPFITRSRSLWYNVAARWGIQEFMAQQERINWTLVQGFNQAVSQTFERQQEAMNQQLQQLRQHQTTLGQQQNHYIQALEQQLRELAGENDLLAGEISQLRLQIELNKNRKKE